MLSRIGNADGVVYGIGSLYTSICPCLILGGIGESIASRDCEKVLMLNGTHDRETSGMAASDVVMAICNALNRVHCRGKGSGSLSNQPSAYITALVVPDGGEIEVDTDNLYKLGIRRVIPVSARTDKDGNVSYMPEEVAATLRQIVEGDDPAEGQQDEEAINSDAQQQNNNDTSAEHAPRGEVHNGTSTRADARVYATAAAGTAHTDE